VGEATRELGHLTDQKPEQTTTRQRISADIQDFRAFENTKKTGTAVAWVTGVILDGPIQWSEREAL
jgi:hypothetical protein